jgi:hypothetical protein
MHLDDLISMLNRDPVALVFVADKMLLDLGLVSHKDDLGIIFFYRGYRPVYDYSGGMVAAHSIYDDLHL